MLKNLPSPRYPSPQNFSGLNASPQQNSPTICPNPRPTRFSLTRPSASKIESEVIANSNINAIPLRERTSQLLVSKKSIQICIDEINKKKLVDNLPLNLTESALELMQAEVTYKLFHLLRVRIINIFNKCVLSVFIYIHTLNKNITPNILN